MGSGGGSRGVDSICARPIQFSISGFQCVVVYETVRAELRTKCKYFPSKIRPLLVCTLYIYHPISFSDAQVDAGGAVIPLGTQAFYSDDDDETEETTTSNNDKKVDSIGKSVQPTSTTKTSSNPCVGRFCVFYTSIVSYYYDNVILICSDFVNSPRSHHGPIPSGLSSTIPAAMNEDHRLLIRSVLPLLRSQNAAVHGDGFYLSIYFSIFLSCFTHRSSLFQVVLAASACLFAVAPASECAVIGRPLVHVARAHPELSYEVLANINTMAAQRPSLFTPYLKSFFVNFNDLVYGLNHSL